MERWRPRPENASNFPPDKSKLVPCPDAPLLELDGILFDPFSLKQVKSPLQHFWHYRNDFSSLEKHQEETFSWNKKDAVEAILEAEQPLGHLPGEVQGKESTFTSGATKVADWFTNLWEELKRVVSLIVLLCVVVLVVLLCRWCKCYRCLCWLMTCCPQNYAGHHTPASDVELANMRPVVSRSL